MSFLVNQDGYYGEFGGAYVPEIDGPFPAGFEVKSTRRILFCHA